MSWLGNYVWRRRLENQWKRSGYTLPAPPQVKECLLRRYHIPGSTWVETGTWMGSTTEFLAGFSKHVWSIEPGPELVRRARKRFESQGNVTIVQGLSEEVLDKVLGEVSGDACLWLDGHFSAGDTFQGPVDTPILSELSIVASHLQRLGRVAVLIDDMRCFDPSQPKYQNYPDRSSLVAWADRNNLAWTIEYDVFVAQTRP